MRTICVIPARLGSTRLKEKMLCLLGGKPLIQHTFERARAVRCFDRVVVACDDARIQEIIRAAGGEAVLTNPRHESGTARILEVVEHSDYELVVNVQGDEPLVHPESLAALVEGMTQCDASVGTLAVRVADMNAYRNPNVVKTIRDKNGYALYFSRAPLPFGRDREPAYFLKHLGIYAYRTAALRAYAKLPPAELEETERLEQLRFLHNGYRIRVWITSHESVGVDTQADLERVETLLKSGRVGS